MNGQRCGAYTHTLTHTHTGILRGHKKRMKSGMCNMMDLEGIMLSEICQSGKDKYHVISLIHGI